MNFPTVLIFFLAVTSRTCHTLRAYHFWSISVYGLCSFEFGFASLSFLFLIFLRVFLFPNFFFGSGQKHDYRSTWFVTNFAKTGFSSFALRWKMRLCPNHLNSALAKQWSDNEGFCNGNVNMRKCKIPLERNKTIGQKKNLVCTFNISVAFRLHSHGCVFPLCLFYFSAFCRSHVWPNLWKIYFSMETRKMIQSNNDLLNLGVGALQRNGFVLFSSVFGRYSVCNRAFPLHVWDRENLQGLISRNMRKEMEIEIRRGEVEVWAGNYEGRRFRSSPRCVIGKTPESWGNILWLTHQNGNLEIQCSHSLIIALGAKVLFCWIELMLLCGSGGEVQHECKCQ